MNSEAAIFARVIAAEVKSHGGLTEFKAQSLKNLELRTVLKESHCSPISQLCFNQLDPTLHNLFASIGKDQVTVYDDLHMGDYLGVVVHYVNHTTPHHQGGDVTCCAWVQATGVTPHECGDAWLAVSGPEGVIQVISVVESCVTQMLKGHACGMVDLSGCRDVAGLLLSLGTDGNLRLWDVPSGTCLASLDTDATTAELHPTGACMLTGHRGGRVCRWPLQVKAAPAAQQQPQAAGPRCRLSLADPLSGQPVAPGAAASAVLQPQLLTQPGGNRLTGTVDCIRVLADGRVAAKSSDGRGCVWDMVVAQPASSPQETGSPGSGQQQQEQEQVALQAVSCFCVPADAHAHVRCLMSASHDGAYLCIGGSDGDAYVHEAATGGRVAQMEFRKVPGPVRCCTLNEDCRHLLAVKGNGFIFRYEYIREDDREESSDSSETETEGTASEGEGSSSDDDQPAAPTAAAAAGPGGSGRSAAGGDAAYVGAPPPPAKRVRGAAGERGGPGPGVESGDAGEDADMEDN